MNGKLGIKTQITQLKSENESSEFVSAFNLRGAVMEIKFCAQGNGGRNVR